MNQEQFQQLLTPIYTHIEVSDLINRSDRTLIYGYTCDRETFHVYLKEEMFHKIIYNHSYKLVSDEGEINPRVIQLEVIETESFYSAAPNKFIPNKRVYPERCDYELCNLLKNKGVVIPFTSWSDNFESKQYYGLLIDGIE